MKALSVSIFFIMSMAISQVNAQYFETCSHDGDFQYKLETHSCDYYFSSHGIVGVLKHFQEDSSVVTLRYDVIFENAQNFEIAPFMRADFRKTIYKNRETRLIKSYEQLWLHEVWNGIDVMFFVKDGQLKYDFHVSGKIGDYKDINLKYVGLPKGTVDGSDLVFQTDMGSLTQQFPAVYSVGRPNALEKSPLKFELILDENVLSFDVEDYDTNKSLVIDPWCTYFGGSNTDETYGLAVDSIGNSVITGYTYSADLPISVGAIDTSYDIDYDAYLAKFDSTGGLLWATYYGGNGGDYGRKVKVDANGNVYATGNTTSTNLMTSPGAYQTTNAGSYDAYLLKVSPSGAFIWSTLFGGSGGDFGMVEEVYNDKVVIGGFTSSMNMPANGFQTSLAGALDCYLAVFDTSGSYEWSTYFGGTNSEDIHAITFDNSGNIIAVGDSYSNDLPVSTGAYQSNNNGTKDIYILKTNPLGAKTFATYFGGYSNDDALAVCVDESDRIYVGGYSQSNDMPWSTGAYQSTLNSAKDGIIARFTPNGFREYCTFFGGNDGDEFTGLASENGKIYALLSTRSTDLLLLGTSHQTTNMGFVDNYILVMDTNFNMAYTTYFGGVSSENAYEIDVTHDEAIYVSGFSSGSDLAFGSNIFQSMPLGGTDAYVLRLDNLEGLFSSIVAHFNDQLTVFPNPVSSNLNLDLSGESLHDNAKVEIYNLKGQILKSFKLTKDVVRLDVQGLSSGAYLMKIFNGPEIFTAKFVKD